MFVLDEGETIRHPHAPRSNQGNSMSAKTSRKYEKTYYYTEKIAWKVDPVITVLGGPMQRLQKSFCVNTQEGLISEQCIIFLIKQEKRQFRPECWERAKTMSQLNLAVPKSGALIGTWDSYCVEYLLTGGEGGAYQLALDDTDEKWGKQTRLGNNAIVIESGNTHNKLHNHNNNTAARGC